MWHSVRKKKKAEADLERSVIRDIKSEEEIIGSSQGEERDEDSIHWGDGKTKRRRVETIDESPPPSNTPGRESKTRPAELEDEISDEVEESKLSKLREVKKEETSDSLHKPRGFLFSHVVTQPPVKPRSTPLSTASPSIYLTVMSEHNTIGRDATVHHAHHPPPPKPKIVPHVEEIESSEDEEEEEENDPLASLTPMFPTNVRERVNVLEKEDVQETAAAPVLSQESDEIEMYDEPEHALEADEVESTEAKTTFLPPPVSPAVEAKANPFRRAKLAEPSPNTPRFLSTIRAPVGDTQTLPDDGRSPHRYNRVGLSARLQRVLGSGSTPEAPSLRLHVVERQAVSGLSLYICVAIDSTPPQYITLALPVSIKEQLDLQSGDSIALLSPWQELSVSGKLALLGANVERISPPENLEEILASEILCNSNPDIRIKKEPTRTVLPFLGRAAESESVSQDYIESQGSTPAQVNAAPARHPLSNNLFGIVQRVYHTPRFFGRHTNQQSSRSLSLAQPSQFCLSALADSQTTQETESAGILVQVAPANFAIVQIPASSLHRWLPTAILAEGHSVMFGKLTTLARNMDMPSLKKSGLWSFFASLEGTGSSVRPLCCQCAVTTMEEDSFLLVFRDNHGSLSYKKPSLARLPQLLQLNAPSIVDPVDQWLSVPTRVTISCTIKDAWAHPPSSPPSLLLIEDEDAVAWLVLCGALSWTTPGWCTVGTVLQLNDVLVDPKLMADKRAGLSSQALLYADCWTRLLVASNAMQ